MKRTEKRGGGPMQLHGRKDLRPAGPLRFSKRQLADLASQVRAANEREKTKNAALAQERAEARKLNR